MSENFYDNQHVESWIQKHLDNNGRMFEVKLDSNDSQGNGVGKFWLAANPETKHKLNVPARMYKQLPSHQELQALQDIMYICIDIHENKHPAEKVLNQQWQINSKNLGL